MALRQPSSFKTSPTHSTSPGVLQWNAPSVHTVPQRAPFQPVGRTSPKVPRSVSGSGAFGSPDSSFIEVPRLGGPPPREDLGRPTPPWFGYAGPSPLPGKKFLDPRSGPSGGDLSDVSIRLDREASEPLPIELQDRALTLPPPPGSQQQIYQSQQVLRQQLHSQLQMLLQMQQQQSTTSEQQPQLPSPQPQLLVQPSKPTPLQSVEVLPVSPLALGNRAALMGSRSGSVAIPVQWASTPRVSPATGSPKLLSPEPAKEKKSKEPVVMNPGIAIVEVLTVELSDERAEELRMLGPMFLSLSVRFGLGGTKSEPTSSRRGSRVALWEPPERRELFWDGKEKWLWCRVFDEDLIGGSKLAGEGRVNLFSADCHGAEPVEVGVYLFTQTDAAGLSTRSYVDNAAEEDADDPNMGRCVGLACLRLRLAGLVN